MLNGDDRPIASFLWPGNTADVTTLVPVVTRLKERFGIGKACIVADRGMISAATIAELEERGIDHILGARERSTAEIRKDVIEDDGVAVPLIIPRQIGSDPARRQGGEGRLAALHRLPQRGGSDQGPKARQHIVEGLARKLAQGDKALVANTGFRRFLEEPAGEAFAMAPAKVEAEARFDGLFVLRINTNRAPIGGSGGVS